MRCCEQIRGHLECFGCYDGHHFLMGSIDLTTACKANDYAPIHSAWNWLSKSQVLHPDPAGNAKPKDKTKDENKTEDKLDAV